jgi:autotransporter-associated beta strand protein
MFGILSPRRASLRSKCFAGGILSAGIVLGSLPGARAASDTWTGAGDALWSNTGNWLGGGIPGAGDTATFNGASSNTTVDLGAGVTLSSLVFDTGSAAAYTIGSGGAGGQTLTLDTLAGGIQMNATVVNNQLIDANLALSTTGTYTVGLTNNSTTNTLTVAGGISASTAGNKTLTVTGAGNTTISGNITNGTGAVALTKTGTGTLSLSGTNSFGIAGVSPLVNAGRISVTAGTTNVSNNFSTIATAASTTATLNVSSGATFGLTGTNGGNIGGQTSASGVVYNAGTFNQTSTAANNAGVYLGNAASSYGYLYNTGTTAINGRVYVGRVDNGGQAGSAGLLDIAGGTVTVSGTNTTVLNGQQGSFLLNTNSNSAATARSSTGYAGVNVHGGTLTLGQAQTFQTNTGANLYTSINVTGSGSKIASTGAAGFNLNFTSDATNTTTLALHNGGSLETSFISNTAALSNAFLSFDNGTLKATAADATGLIRSGVTTYIQSGGATIDTNGFNTTIATPLQAPSGNGVTSIALGGTATGYVGAPIVQITGGGGTGAAAIANFDPATGTVTGITVTAAGSGYTSAPTITLVGGNGGTTGVGVGTATGTASIGAVTSGGFTKTGAGTLTLSATNTYTGGTTINAGTLALGNATDTLADTGAVNVNGGTLSLGANSDTVGAVTLTSGSITSTTGTLTGSSYGVQSGSVSAKLGGSGIALTKSTGGTVTLSGANTYTGATNVNAGTLVFSGATSTVGSVAVADGANLQVKVFSPSSNVLSATSLTLGSTSGSTLTVDFTTLANPTAAPITLSGDLTINGATLAGVNAAGLTNTNGTPFTLLSAVGGITGTFTNSTVTLGARSTGAIGYTSNAVTLDVSTDSITWSGASNSTWATGTTGVVGPNPNWATTNGHAATDFWATDIVKFGDTYNVGSGDTPVANSAVSISGGNVNPASVTFDNSAVDYTISSSDGSGITGTGALTKNGTGTATISTANSYSGGTAINAGTLALSGSGTLGSTSGAVAIGGGKLDLGGTSQTVGAVTITAPAASGDTIQNGTLTPTSLTASHSSGNAVVSASIAGSGGITMNGAGTLTLSGANTYTGATTVSSGTVAVSGSGTLGNGAALMMGGGTLDLGTTSQTVGATTITAAAASGNTIENGTLTPSSLTASHSSGNAIVAADIAGSGAVAMSGAGTLTLSGTNSYTGATTVNAGTLALSGTYTGGGALTVNAGATFTGASSGTNTLGNFTVTGASSSATLTSGTYNVASTAGGGVTNSKINNGGSLTVDGATLNITGNAAWFPIGDTANTTSTVTVNSGAINVTNGFGAEVGRIGNGVLNINGGAFIVDDVNSVGLVIGDQGTAQSGTVNLNGGVLAVRKLASNNGTNALNFNGGTLQATGTNAGGTFWNSSAKLTANVRNNGGTIDNNGTSVTIGQALVHSTIGGDNAADGGMTFKGAGTTTLSGASTYTGATLVNGGTLVLASTGSLNTSISLGVASGATLELDNSISLNDAIVLSLVDGATLSLNFAAGEAETVGALSLNGVSAPAGTYTVAELGALTGAGTISFTGTGSLTVAAVPEPSVLGLLGLGLASVLFLRRRRC